MKFPTHLEQVLAHVIAKVLEERDFLGERVGEGGERVVVLVAVALDVLHVLLVGGEQETRGVVEEHAHAVVAQLVAQAVLVRVVHPLAHPVDRDERRILSLV